MVIHNLLVHDSFEDGKRPLKLVIYRPHSNIWFRNTVGRLLKRKPMPNKYAQLLDYLLGSGVSLHFAIHLSEKITVVELLRRLRDGFELVLWCLLNRISLRKTGLVFTHSALARNDVLFLMHYGNLTYETEKLAESGLELAQYLASVDIPKVVHLTHYAYCAESGARNLVALKPALLVAENNLAANSLFFSKYFSELPGDFYTLPYTPAQRFQDRVPFHQRVNKMVVTGSITYKMKSVEFIDFFKVNELQPLRRKLYEQAGGYLDQMECLVSDLDASRASPNPQSGLRFSKLADRLRPKSTQNEYYKKDIVEIYNTYAMFAVPEEVCDLPAIGFVEGMACGSAYLGVPGPMYEDIGMKAGVHYIPYDGTVEDLMSRVRYYQQYPLEVARIAEAGSRFVREQLSAEVIYGKFIARLQLVALSHRQEC